MSATPINTNVRLFDLVRYMRSELHQANLITDDEYSWLCMEAPLSKGKGSPSPRRLEDYDALRAELAQARAECERLREILSTPSQLRAHTLRQFPDYAWESAEFIGRLRAAAEEADRLRDKFDHLANLAEAMAAEFTISGRGHAGSVFAAKIKEHRASLSSRGDAS